MRLTRTILSMLALGACATATAADQSGGGAGGAAGGSSPGTAATQPLTASEFVRKAAQTGLFEVRSAQLALDKQIDQQLQQTANQLIEDHRKANDELRSLAQRKGYDVPQSLDDEHQQKLDQLRQEQGQQFAQSFQQIQQQTHQQAIALFQQAQDELQDPELKQWAARTLPVLQQHQQHLQKQGSSSGMQSDPSQGSSSGMQPDPAQDSGMLDQDPDPGDAEIGSPY